MKVENRRVNPAMTSTWIDELPAEMANHAAMLRRLLAYSESDPRVRALQVQGSIGRGTPDRYSDIDLGVAVDETAWPMIAEEFVAVVRGLGDVVDDFYSYLPSAQAPQMFRAWAQLGNGVQIDAMVMPSSRVAGSGPDGRTLLDRDGLLLRTDHPKRMTDAAAAGEWAFLTWHALTQTTKYLERGRPAAAAQWLGAARQTAISCWGAGHGLEYAAFPNVAAGQLGVLCPWPEGFDDTYSAPEPMPLVAAAIALTRIQARADDLLADRFGLAPRPLAHWVSSRLELLREGLLPLGSPPALSSPRGTPSPAKRPSSRRPAAPRPRRQTSRPKRRS